MNPNTETPEQLDLSQFEGHTPGPWAVNPAIARVDAFDGPDASPVPVCELLWPTDHRSEEETEANGHLIAAAPRLVAEVKRLRAEKAELVAALERAELSTAQIRISANIGHKSDKQKVAWFESQLESLGKEIRATLEDLAKAKATAP